MDDYTAKGVRDSAWYDDGEEPTPTTDEARRDLYLRSKYGITLHDYQAQLKRQRYRCDICRNKFPPDEVGKTAFVDHDHLSGMVRGLLCTRCNTGIGFFKDDERLLIRAATYLLKYRRARPDLGLELPERTGSPTSDENGESLVRETPAPYFVG